MLLRARIATLTLLAVCGCDDKTSDDKSTADPSQPSAASDAKTSDAKTSDAKAGDAKAGDAKAGDVKAEPGPTKAEPDAPKLPPEQRPPQPTAMDGVAEITITGAWPKQITADDVQCGFTHIDGRDQGGSWRVSDDTYELAVIVVTDDAWNEPSLLLNVKGADRKSFVRKPGGNIKVARDRTIVEIDEDLRDVVGTDTVHVKGTMKCPPRPQ